MTFDKLLIRVKSSVIHLFLDEVHIHVKYIFWLFGGDEVILVNLRQQTICKVYLQPLHVKES